MHFGEFKKRMKRAAVESPCDYGVRIERGNQKQNRRSCPRHIERADPLVADDLRPWRLSRKREFFLYAMSCYEHSEIGPGGRIRNGSFLLSPFARIANTHSRPDDSSAGWPKGPPLPCGMPQAKRDFWAFPPCFSY